MAKITKEMKEVAEKARVFAVATATKDSVPNVVPIAFGKIFSDDEILLVDVFMKKTVENINANPRVAISVWDAESKGYQFKGDARIETSGEAFNEGIEMVKVKEPQLNPKAVVIVKIISVYLITPGFDAGKQVS